MYQYREQYSNEIKHKKENCKLITNRQDDIFLKNTHIFRITLF